MILLAVMDMFCFIGFCQSSVGLRGGLNVTPYDQFEIIGPTFGVDLIAQGANHHVISLVDLGASFIETDTQIRFELHQAISYQFEHHFNPQKRVHPSFGGFLSLKSDHITNEPKINSFKVRRMIFTSGLYALPGLHYNVGKATLHF